MTHGGSGGLRAPTRTFWGWNANAAKKITVPTMIMVGEQDSLMNSNRDLFADSARRRKWFLSIACATHFVVWEKQRRVLYRASAEWCAPAGSRAQKPGTFAVNDAGRLQSPQ